MISTPAGRTVSHEVFKQMRCKAAPFVDTVVINSLLLRSGSSF